jgi:hypothetical protein
MYQHLSQDCRYTHRDAILAFNVAADELGVPNVTMKPEEYDYEEDYEEEDDRNGELAETTDPPAEKATETETEAGSA